MVKKIFVACGTGIATSTIAANKIKEAISDKFPDVKLSITQGKVSEIQNADGNYDLIVSTTQTPVNMKTTVIQGLPFLTGIGVEKVIDDIVKALELK